MQLIEIWHTLSTEMFLLTAKVVFLHQAHNFGSQVLGSMRQEKTPSEDSDSDGMESLYGFGIHLLYPPSFSLYLSPSLSFTMYSQRLFTISKCCRLLILSFHSSVPLCISSHPILQLVQLLKTLQNIIQLSFLPDHSYVLWQSGHRVSGSHFFFF